METATLPNFLVVGAQKCGTTWLHKMLSQHPEIFLPEKKELEYFSYTYKNTLEGSQEYLSHFKPGAKYKVRGEITPSYFWNTQAYSDWCKRRPRGFHPDIPENVRCQLGRDVKMIVILRNPVERAVSAYFHHYRRNRFSIDRSILDVGKVFGIIHMGFYFEHLKCWLRYFPMESIKVLIFEEVMNDRSAALRDIFNFLDVADDFQPKNVEKVVYEGHKRSRTDGEIYVKDDEGNEQRVISREDYDALKNIYKQDCENLSALLDKNLNSIWQFLPN